MPANLINNELISDFAKGDKNVFALIYNQYQQIVFNNISKIILQEHVVEDILQDVFFKLWENKHKFQDEHSIASWLFRVSYNQSITYIRHIIKEKKYLAFKLPEAIQEQIFTHNKVEIEELKESLLTDAINKLPKRKKQVFELCKLQGKSYAETASILGISPDTVKEHMIFSLKFIRNYVRSKYSTESIAVLSILSIYLQA